MMFHFFSALMFSVICYRMTLLLGPPSSGKTTLLLALAGKLDHALKVMLMHSFDLNLCTLSIFEIFSNPVLINPASSLRS